MSGADSTAAGVRSHGRQLRARPDEVRKARSRRRECRWRCLEAEPARRWESGHEGGREWRMVGRYRSPENEDRVRARHFRCRRNAWTLRYPRGAITWTWQTRRQARMVRVAVRYRLCVARGHAGAARRGRAFREG